MYYGTVAYERVRRYESAKHENIHLRNTTPRCMYQYTYIGTIGLYHNF